MSKYSDLFRAVSRTEEPDESADVEESAGSGGGFTLLFVDDEEGVLRALERIFFEENYRILTATSGEKALALLEKEKIHLVISDHRMPGMTGAVLLKEIKQRWPETIRIMLTGHADVQSVMGAVKDGAVFKFITKPWNDEDLRLTVSLGLQQFTLIQENRRLKDIARKQQLKIKNYAGIFDDDKSALGHILVSAGVLKREDVERGRKERQNGEFLGDTLVRLGLTSEAKIVGALQNHLKIECIDLQELAISAGVVKCLPREVCERNRLIPVKLEGNQLTLAMADPSDILKCDNIAMATGLRVTPLLAASSEILAQLQRAYRESEGAEAEGIDTLLDIEPMDEIDIVIDDDENDVSVEELIGSSKIPPIIRIVNAIISEAIRYRASDIHVEPKTKYTVVRFRIDGLLHSKIKIPADLHQATISRLKILAKMDIAERRRPQDGRITVKAGTRIVDLRASSMPTISGEKMVMRILDKSSAVKKLSDLGVLPDDLKRIATISRRPQGVVIATGPTGSGKTTLLYSLLSAMMQSSKNFETIEEPVEYFLEEANQVAVREKIGLSFAQVLRATLRQDPDVILVGEVRDQETADVAFKASLTGHMVLTTLHTNSSVASITRLMDMGVKPYIIASALEAIMAQRLVRRVCRHCREEVPVDREELELLRLSPEQTGETVWVGKGCGKCDHTGYSGRIGVFELFVMNDDFRHFISSDYRESELLEMARAQGMLTLLEDGAEKVRRGETTLKELLRVIGPQMSYERSCPDCSRVIDAKFLFCPYCGAFRQNMCRHCKMPLDDDWTLCPFCGTQKLVDAYEPTGV